MLTFPDNTGDFILFLNYHLYAFILQRFILQMSQQVARQIAAVGSRTLKPKSFWNNLFTDKGNIPLVAANAAGALLVVGFGGRKMFYHPDISISEELRSSGLVQNETPVRLQDADAFRNQTRQFATQIEKIGLPIINLFVGPQGPSAKWNLEFTEQVVPVPLERTNHFQDGLYQDVAPIASALDEPAAPIEHV